MIDASLAPSLPSRQQHIAVRHRNHPVPGKSQRVRKFFPVVEAYIRYQRGDAVGRKRLMIKTILRQETKKAAAQREGRAAELRTVVRAINAERSEHLPASTGDGGFAIEGPDARNRTHSRILAGEKLLERKRLRKAEIAD